MRLPLRVALLVAAVASQSPAQLVDSVPAATLSDGMRVRVTATRPALYRATGIAHSIETGGFRLVRDWPASRIPLRYLDIEVLELSQGRRRGAAAFNGFWIGLVGGAALGYLACTTAPSNDPCFGPAGFGLSGAVLGPVVGAVFAPERWRVVPHQRRQASRS